MGGRKLANPQQDNLSKRNDNNKQQRNNQPAVLAKTQTRRGEVQRAMRRTSDDVRVRASQHVLSNIPVNKSIYNGLQGQQLNPATLKEMGQQQRKQTKKTLRIIPIGGLGEMGIGKNMTAIEYGEDIIVVDMGFIFPGDGYPGVNYITPDITYLEERKDRIKAIIFTHAHLDHIGSFRHFAEKVPAPIYGTKFTIGMLKRQLEEVTTDYEPEYIEVDPWQHDQIPMGNHMTVEMVHVLHSIPGCVALIFRTPMGVVLHTGDWRFEDETVDGKPFDMERLTEIATKEGIMMMLNESTNVDSPDSPAHSELDVGKNIGLVMDGYPSSRIIASCFSTQIHRLQLILNEAKAHDRKVAFAGYSMINNLEIALRTGEVTIPKDTVVKMEDIIKLPDGRVTIVCTGSQGEYNAVLSRMVTGAHRHIKIKKNDVVVFSSSPIPGNEPAVAHTVDGLMREGAEVIQHGRTHIHGIGPLHLSGHASYAHHITMVNAMNPTYYMPIHGEFHMLAHNARLAEVECGMPRENILVCDSGDIVEIDENKNVRKTGRIQVGGIMYDDSGSIVSEVVLKDRMHMSNEGMFVVVLTVSQRGGRLMTSPDIISRGFIYLRDSEELMGKIRQYLKQKMQRAYSGKKPDIEILKKELRDEITHVLYDETRRTPIVIPVINEVGDNQTSFSGGKKPRVPAGPKNPRQPMPAPQNRQFGAQAKPTASQSWSR